MEIIMINPDTGKPEKITGEHAGLWVFLLGPFYFMWKGMWSYVVPFGYLFYIGEYVKDSYRRRGWKDVAVPKHESKVNI